MSSTLSLDTRTPFHTTRPTSTSSNFFSAEIEHHADPQHVSIGYLTEPTTFTKCRRSQFPDFVVCEEGKKIRCQESGALRCGPRRGGKEKGDIEEKTHTRSEGRSRVRRKKFGRRNWRESLETTQPVTCAKVVTKQTVVFLHSWRVKKKKRINSHLCGAPELIM